MNLWYAPVTSQPTNLHQYQSILLKTKLHHSHNLSSSPATAQRYNPTILKNSLPLKFPNHPTIITLLKSPLKLSKKNVFSKSKTQSALNSLEKT